jgi:hypothetical protein
MRPSGAGHESTGSGDFTLGQPARDEAAFYAAETQSLSRENAMLRQRIRELERQLSGTNLAGSSATPTSVAAAGRDAHSQSASGPASAGNDEGKEE